MKKILLSVSIAIGFCFSAAATHIVGGEVSYKYIGDSTGIMHQYEATIKLYRDITPGSAPIGPTQHLVVKSSCYPDINTTFNRIVPPAGQGAGDGGFLPSSLTACNDSTNNFPKSIHIFSGTVILPGVCADYIFETTTPCCRSGSIYNLSSSSSSAMYLYATLNNTLGENNSLIENPLLHAANICTGIPIYLPSYEKDADGDSVAFSLSQPLGNNRWDSIPFATGYSISNPIFTQSGISIDQRNGILSFTPVEDGVFALAVKASEYRYDTTIQQYVLISETQTDAMLFILSSCNLQSLKWDFEDFDTTSTSSVINCFDTLITLRTNHLFLASSLHSTDFGMIGSSGNVYPVINAFSNNNDGYANEINLVAFQPFTVNDTITLYSKTGIDGNSIINSCGFEMEQDSMLLFVNNCHVSLEETKETGIFIYPNPVGDILYLKIKGDQKVSGITILDNAGKTVQSFPGTNHSDADLEINVSGLEKGLYILELRDRSGRSTGHQKFVRQ